MFNNRKFLLFSNDDLIGIKFQKYFKRYFPNQLQAYNYNEQLFSRIQSIDSSKIEYVIINSLESKKEFTKRIVNYFSRFAKIIIIQKSSRNTYRTFKNITFVKISNFIGFNDKIDEIQSLGNAKF